MADNTKRIYIGGSLMPKLSSLEITREPVWSANTGRNAEGKMIGTIVAQKMKLKITFVPLSDAEARSLDLALTPAFFDVKFWSPSTNSQVTKTMYAGTPTYPVYSYASGYPRYVGVGVDLIEQ